MADSVCQEQTEPFELEVRTPNGPRCGVPVSDLQKLLLELVARYGTQTALAKAIGITPSRLTRILKGEDALNVKNCLQLAKVADLSPSQILRAADKSDIADLIEELYGKEAPIRVAGALEDRWPELSTDAKEALKAFLDKVGRDEPKGRKRKKRT